MVVGLVQCAKPSASVSHHLLPSTLQAEEDARMQEAYWEMQCALLFRGPAYPALSRESPARFLRESGLSTYALLYKVSLMHCCKDYMLGHRQCLVFERKSQEWPCLVSSSGQSRGIEGCCSFCSSCVCLWAGRCLVRGFVHV